MFGNLNPAEVTTAITSVLVAFGGFSVFAVKIIRYVQRIEIKADKIETQTNGKLDQSLDQIVRTQMRFEGKFDQFTLDVDKRFNRIESRSS